MRLESKFSDSASTVELPRLSVGKILWQVCPPFFKVSRKATTESSTPVPNIPNEQI